MYSRWSKRVSTPYCPSGSEWYVCDSGLKFVGCCTVDPCSDSCPERDVRPATFRNPRNRDKRPTYFGKREQTSEGPVTSHSSTPTASATGSILARTTSSTITNTSSPSVSSTTTPAPSHRPNVALIAGAAGGGFALAVLAGVIIFFWLHTQKSRRQHHRTFERRLSDLGEPDEMTQKPLVRPSHIARVPTAHLPSPNTTPSSDTDPHPYRHYSAEHFSVPEPPAPSSPFDAWKMSHPTPSDLARKSIGTFELESPVSPEQWSAATSRNGSLVSSRKNSLGSSRKSSLAGGQGISVPTLVPPVPTAAAWNTHRRSASAGVL